MPSAKTLTALSILLFLSTTTNAQQEKQIRTGPSGLALEVLYYKDAPPSYLAVPGPDAQARGAWYARFGRLPGWQLPAGHLPIGAVNVVSRLDSDTVSISVSVLRGVKFHDQEDMVGTYRLRENETVLIRELEQFGVEPFRIGVVRVAPSVSALPLVKSLAQSLEVVAIEPIISTLPTYKLTLHNLSDKNISAIRIEVLLSGKTELTSMPQGKDGFPLISAGAFYERHQPIATRAQKTAAGYAPDSTRPQTTVISAVMFEDGSYEGDVEPAAEFRAYGLGRKLALTRLLPLFSGLDENLPKDQETTGQLKWLRNRLLAFSDEIEEKALAPLQAEFPGLELKKKVGLRTAAQVALHGVRQDLLTELETLEKSQPADPSDLRAWLLRVGDRYRSWLSRL